VAPQACPTRPNQTFDVVSVSIIDLAQQMGTLMGAAVLCEAFQHRGQVRGCEPSYRPHMHSPIFGEIRRVTAPSDEKLGKHLASVRRIGSKLHFQLRNFNNGSNIYQNFIIASPPNGNSKASPFKAGDTFTLVGQAQLCSISQPRESSPGITAKWRAHIHSASVLLHSTFNARSITK